MFYFLLVVAAAFIAFASGECPGNSINLKKEPSFCYSFHSTPTKFTHAQSHCESFGGNLVTIKNENVNGFISELAIQVFDYKNTGIFHFWSGGYRLSHETNFKWISGEKFEYDNYLNLGLKGKNFACISVLFMYGWWKPESCYNKLSFICQFKASKNAIPLDADSFNNIAIDSSIWALTKKSSTTIPPTPVSLPSCKDGWVYFEKTKSCYYVSAFDTKPWKEAEEACQKEGAHLVSIHSAEENRFVMEVSNSKYKFDEKCWENQIWIGFLEENHVFSWTDGTPNDFTNWNVDEPNNAFRLEHCGSIYTHTCQARQSKFKWNDFFCNAELPYICKMPANYL